MLGFRPASARGPLTPLAHTSARGPASPWGITSAGLLRHSLLRRVVRCHLSTRNIGFGPRRRTHPLGLSATAPNRTPAPAPHARSRYTNSAKMLKAVGIEPGTGSSRGSFANQLNYFALLVHVASPYLLKALGCHHNYTSLHMREELRSQGAS